MPLEVIRPRCGQDRLDGRQLPLERLRLDGGTESRIDTPLYRVCEEYVAERLPGATLLPLLTTGFTDSHWVRQAHGTVAYGFAPVFATDPVAYERGIHNADESVAVDDLSEMAEFHLHAVQALPRAALGR